MVFVYLRIADVDVIGKFAQLEYKYGEAWHGASLFEKVLGTYPKRTDIWYIYIDQVAKTGTVEEAR